MLAYLLHALSSRLHTIPCAYPQSQYEASSRGNSLFLLFFVIMILSPSLGGDTRPALDAFNCLGRFNPAINNKIKVARFALLIFYILIVCVEFFK